jgi:hypothetical protein
MVSTEWKAASGELETQAATLTAVNAQIGALGAKVEEVLSKIEPKTEPVEIQPDESMEAEALVEEEASE